MRTLLNAAVAVVLLFGGLTEAKLKEPWKLSLPTGLPFKCSNGQPMHDCSRQQLCAQNPCPSGYRCVENYCGTCQATCVKHFGKKSCDKRTKWSPVCGRDGKTYSSSCQARRAGVKVAFGRACNALGGGCSCDMEYDPVCGNNKFFYINRCVARICAKTTIAPWANCESQLPNPDCFCPYVYMPVCGVNGVTYSNACEAGCYNMAVAYEGECKNTCKALYSECELAKQECCKGLFCGGHPVQHVNVTTGRCWDEKLPPPIGH